ncbi:SymE family type I addiction module toxin [Gilliamella sp. B2865]|uniref:SymE family type I addiction module toxin n=1 Tax=Gilliamella sp. B2785 TaxID=2817982 RepID=UPI002B494A3C|nr:SymE family type I addiction module toxin [Gilliamella sp. B2785]MCX8670872.1 SymE family type I addiction module toxin [Gilliamella sp. B2785]MCX8679213.1 SymE family type I addiction module toxin [Gilliamella sp. B2865]
MIHRQNISVHYEHKAAQARTHYSNPPALHLKGDWLEAVGFATGQTVTITAKKAS